MGPATGRFEGPPLLKEEKKRRVLEFLRARGERPESCAFYSDSILDLPLLEAVGRPVAVNPDARLRLQRPPAGLEHPALLELLL